MFYLLLMQEVFLCVLFCFFSIQRNLAEQECKSPDFPGGGGGVPKRSSDSETNFKAENCVSL